MNKECARKANSLESIVSVSTNGYLNVGRGCFSMEFTVHRANLSKRCIAIELGIQPFVASSYRTSLTVREDIWTKRGRWIVAVGWHTTSKCTEFCLSLWQIMKEYASSVLTITEVMQRKFVGHTQSYKRLIVQISRAKQSGSQYWKLALSTNRF